MAWKEAESNYTQGERWFILYDYLRRNSRKGHPVSRKQIFDYLSANHDITISPHTFYADMEILSNDAFGLHIELDRSAFHSKGGCGQPSLQKSIEIAGYGVDRWGEVG